LPVEFLESIARQREENEVNWIKKVSYFTFLKEKQFLLKIYVRKTAKLEMNWKSGKKPVLVYKQIFVSFTRKCKQQLNELLTR
jgi:hypothetical protein